jgi:hypothetical protein
MYIEGNQTLTILKNQFIIFDVFAFLLIGWMKQGQVGFKLFTLRQFENSFIILFIKINK